MTSRHHSLSSHSQSRPLSPEPTKTASYEPSTPLRTSPASALPPASNTFAMSGSAPPQQPGTLPDHFMRRESDIDIPRISPTNVKAAALSPQKRAYRQRRKDPSCDACREQKVKCDATDASSCSNCSTRGVGCQFTKETNRRMSSAKQVQDLKRELSLAKQQINRLQAKLDQGGATDWDMNAMNVPAFKMPGTPENSSKEHRPELAMIEGFHDVQANIRDYARGIFEPPPPHRISGRQRKDLHVTRSLPPKHTADELLSHYHGSVHVHSPHLHWLSFVQEYESLYRAGTFEGCSHTWMAVFYAVLACGTLADPQSNRAAQMASGENYIGECMRSAALWDDGWSLNAPRVALLLSVYFIEINRRSATLMWLDEAVRTAQKIGLHLDRGRYPPLEAEMRRRVWWCVYNWDRLVSLEIGRPVQVHDHDCDVAEPAPADDECISEDGNIMSPSGSRSPSGLIAVIPVQRITTQLKRTLQAPVIDAATLNTYDQHFESIMASYPDPYPINSPAFLDPRLVTAACSLQVTRLFLYRHNLSPACPPDLRRDALDRCILVAKDTAHYLQRSMQHLSASRSGQAYYAPSPTWQARLRTTAPVLFCKHLWRCALVLCVGLEWEAASTIVEASAAIGDMRQTNIACGRNLAFFLDRLIDRLRRGATWQNLQTDEEMMAYASGDLQGCIEEFWVWTGSEMGSSHNSQDQAQQTGGYQSPSKRLDIGPLTEREMQEWGGWDRVLQTVKQLQHEQTLHQDQHASAAPPPPQHHCNYVSTYPPLPQTPLQQCQQQLSPQIHYLPPPGPSQTSIQHQPLAPQPHTHPESLSPGGSTGVGPGGGSGGNGNGDGGRKRITIGDITQAG